MNRICNILTVMSIFTLGCAVAIPAMAESLRITEGNSMTEIKKTFLFGGGNRDQSNDTSSSDVTAGPGIDTTGLAVGAAAVNPNPFGIDPEVMRRTTFEARRQTESLVREIRSGGKIGGGGGTMPGYNGIDRPF